MVSKKDSSTSNRGHYRRFLQNTGGGGFDDKIDFLDLHYSMLPKYTYSAVYKSRFYDFALKLNLGNHSNKIWFFPVLSYSNTT